MLLHNKALSPKQISELRQKIRIILNPHQEILLAYLYGSVVNGSFTSHSDIDIGLYITPETLENRWYPIRLKNELENNLDLGFQPKHEIEIQIINQTSPKFQYSVIFKNPRILVRVEQVRVDFEKKVLLKWYDMRHLGEFLYRKRRVVKIEQLKSNH
ncbi:MAG: nucleotidyltransferase domain-containing protein [Promethearchaeota archaeon]